MTTDNTAGECAYLITTTTGRRILVTAHDEDEARRFAWDGFAVKSYEIADVLRMVNVWAYELRTSPKGEPMTEPAFKSGEPRYEVGQRVLDLTSETVATIVQVLTNGYVVTFDESTLTYLRFNEVTALQVIEADRSRRLTDVQRETILGALDQFRTAAHYHGREGEDAQGEYGQACSDGYLHLRKLIEEA